MLEEGADGFEVAVGGSVVQGCVAVIIGAGEGVVRGCEGGHVEWWGWREECECEEGVEDGGGGVGC